MTHHRTPSGPGVAASFPAIYPGALVAGYRVLRALSEGPMGMVYLGEHLHLGRQVAIKVLHPEFSADESAVARFFAEAVAVARVSHPGVVSVFDYGSSEGGAYLIMEYLQGESLANRLLREHHLTIPRTLDIGVQLGLTLAAAHAAGVVHRDLKPENIHLVPDPAGTGYEFVKVLDFGVAKLTAGIVPPLTRRGELLGSPFHMAPEQSIDPSAVDQRSDVYSLGCLLFQITTGVLPFHGSVNDVLIAHRTAPPPSPRAIDPSMPVYLESLILRMMAKSPRQRPSSMMEVVGALSSLQQQQRPW